MRRALGKFLSDLIAEDPSVMVIVGDGGQGVFDTIRDRFPHHYTNAGVTEQATIGIAAGMALEGLKPWVYGITPFMLERPFEQLKLDVVQQKANVKVIGYWDYPTAGPTHKPLDVATTCRVLGLPLLEPKTMEETHAMLRTAYTSSGPYFISLTRAPTP